MALISCPGCGKRVSDRATICPKCGHPIAGRSAESATAAGGARPFENSRPIPESRSKTNFGCIAIVIALIVGIYWVVSRPWPQSVPFAVQYSWGREDNVIANDRYYVEATIYHKSDRPVSGTLTVRAYGDVFGRGGEKRPEGDNYDVAQLTNAKPGTTDGIPVRYYINHPELKANNLPDETVKQRADLLIVVVFEPAPGDKQWRATSWVFRIERGVFTDFGSISDYRDRFGRSPGA